MTKLIKNWEELAKVPANDTYKLTIDIRDGCGWIEPIEETKETREDWYEHHVYLSTHTFYGNHYEESTRILQEHGFDVEIDNWDAVYKILELD